MPEPLEAHTVIDRGLPWLASAGSVLASDRRPLRARWRGRVGTIVMIVLAGLAVVWLGQLFAAFRVSEVVDGRTVYAYRDLWAFDFDAYVEAARRLVATGSPYQDLTVQGPFHPGPYGLYLYSPVLATSLVPVAGLRVEDSSVLWYAVHVLTLAASCALMPVQPRLRVAAGIAAVFSFAVMRDLVLGNVSVLLLLPMVITWRWLDRPQGAAGLALALAVRPTLGIVLVWQILRRQWRPVAWTVGLGLLLIAATLPFVGLGGYLDYLAVLRNMSDVTGVLNNQDISTTLLGLGAGREVAELGLMAAYAVAIAALLVSLRRDRETGYLVAVTASLLLSPLLWDHYLATLILPAAFLAQRWTPLALGIPLLSWAPGGSFALIIVAVLALLLLAPRESRRAASARPGAPDPGFRPSSA